MKEKLRKNRVIIWIISIFMIIMYGLVGILGIPEVKDYIAFRQIETGYYIIGLLFILIIFIFEGDNLKKDFFSYFKHPLRNILETLKYLLLGVVTFALVRLFTSSIINVQPTGDSLIKTAFKSFPLYVVFVTVIYTPFVEEMTFRKFLSNIINNNFFFIFISASLFGYCHIMGTFSNAIQFVSLFVPVLCFGIVLSYSYKKTDNIFVPIFIHLLYNIMVFLTF